MSGLDDFPKALNGWQSKLYDLGYPGPYEVGAMLNRLPIDASDLTEHRRTKLELSSNYGNDVGPWMAGYSLDRGIDPWAGGLTPEEAVANLMIAHPELWRAKP